MTAGLGLARAANVLQEGRSAAVSGLLKELQSRAEGGNSLLECRPILVRLFGDVTSELLIAGEQGGNLEKALASASSYVDTQLSLRRKIFLAAAYPLFVALCGLILLPIPTLFSKGIVAAVWSYYLPVATLLMALYLFFLWLRFKWQEKGRFPCANRGKIEVHTSRRCLFSNDGGSALFLYSRLFDIGWGGHCPRLLKVPAAPVARNSCTREQEKWLEEQMTEISYPSCWDQLIFCRRALCKRLESVRKTGNLEGSCSAHCTAL